jgi:hypothetical protein
VKQTASPQQIINRLAEWLFKDGEASAKCKLRKEPRRRRGGGCSACTAPQELEINQAVGKLIGDAVFKRVGVCPYRVVASHLVSGLTLGPEASRARSVGQFRVDPVAEIKGARRRIRNILQATRLSRDEIEAISISHNGDRWQALYAVLVADRALEKALALFQTEIPAKTSRSPRGRTGALHNQAVARALALAWRQLTGRLPAKDNSKFHDLLQDTIASIFGHPVEEPNLESSTRTAVERIRKDAASGS